MFKSNVFNCFRINEERLKKILANMYVVVSKWIINGQDQQEMLFLVYIFIFNFSMTALKYVCL